MARPLNLFYSYSHADEGLRNKLETHLSPLRRENLISDWHDRRINPGEDWDGVIDAHLMRADIVLLLISADFMESDYCWHGEMEFALKRHSAKLCRVIPVILRTCYWESSIFARLQCLPKNGKPVMNWPDLDQALTDVTDGVRRTIESLTSGSMPEDAEHGDQSLCLHFENREISWKLNASHLYYINVPRVAMLAETLGFDIDVSRLSGSLPLSSMGIQLVRVMQAYEEVFDHLQCKALPLQEIQEFEPGHIGALVSFEEWFYPRNVPSPELVISGKFKLRGDLTVDPVVWKRHGKTSLFLTIDPQYLTTQTTFSDFKRRVRLTGLCSIKYVGADMIRATPLVLGVPRSVFDELFQ
jgi:TIR domain